MSVVYLDRRTTVLAAAALCGVFIAGILIGHFGSGFAGSSGSSSEPAGEGVSPLRLGRREGRRNTEDLNELISETVELVKADNIRSYLSTLAAEPHIASSDRDRFLTSWIKEKWEQFGLDTVDLETYNFLLSYPDPSNPNKIHLKDEAGAVQFSSRHKEEVLRPEDEHQDFIHAFNGFSPAASVTGDLVYVNYGRVEDINKLQELGVNLTGRIAISRYGRIFRGNRVQNCETAGAIGVIMYSDPATVAPYGEDPASVYPNTMFLPESGVERGAVMITADGDPLSPGRASVDGAYRNSLNESESYFPGIPSQPIGYGDARRLLELMGGAEVPEDWRGGLAGLQYRLGPGFDQEHRGWSVNLVTHNTVRDTKSDDVIGVIRGREEPDRYVIIGNHRDAWGYGAVDPSSGTAPMMEMARVLGEQLRGGWRPRRSVVLASWASEESGLMGSWEWAMDKIHKLSHGAVGYINVDSCVTGDILGGKASPALKQVFVNAMKGVKTQKRDRSFFDFLGEYHTNGSTTGEAVSAADKIGILGSGSDQTAFAFNVGVPSIMYYFLVDKQKYNKFSGFYPTYHTGFETFYLVDKILDPGFKTSRSCAQLGLHMALQLADTPVLQTSLEDMTSLIEETLTGFENSTFPSLRKYGAGDSVDVLIKAFHKFKAAASKFSAERDAMVTMVSNMQETPELALKRRILNDKLLQLERIFLLPGGLPGRPHYKHALFSPSKFNSYAGAVFPGLADAMHGFDDLQEEEKMETVKEVKKHLSDVMMTFRQAAGWLTGPGI